MREAGIDPELKKDSVVPFNISGNAELTTLSGEVVGVKEDFKYLGSYISSTGKDIDMRKAQAWRALHKLNNIWHSNMSDALKRRIFVASVESILTYGCEAWTLTVRDETRLDGCYTRMLRKVLNVTWQDRIPNEVLYGGLPPLTTKIRTRRLRLAGHCIRHDDVAAHSLVLWEPQQGRASRGGQRSTFIDTLKRDTGLQSTSEIRTLMLDRSLWQATTCGSRGDLA